VVHHRVGWLDWLFVDLSRIGAEGLVWLALALFLAALWRRPSIFVLVAGADLAADGIAYELREAIDRRRPPLVYPEPKPLMHLPHQPSFPSGHSATAFACATVIAWGAPRLRVPAFVLAAAIAWSRVYVGVHWPLDVLGGAALGILVSIALLMLAAVLRRSLRPRQTG
jgi:undecaprenyl-diphosphatase